MVRSKWLSAALFLGVLVVACQTSTGATDGKQDDLCEPGAFVFCYCKNEERGTKLCQSDGNTFTQCKANGETLCDEIEGEDSNKKVDENGAVLPEGDDDDDVVVVGSSDLDKCPGKSISIRADSSVKLEGDTSRATQDVGSPGTELEFAL